MLISLTIAGYMKVCGCSRMAVHRRCIKGLIATISIRNLTFIIYEMGNSEHHNNTLMFPSEATLKANNVVFDPITQTLHRSYTDVTQELHRGYEGVTSVLRGIEFPDVCDEIRGSCEETKELHRGYTDVTQELHRGYEGVTKGLGESVDSNTLPECEQKYEQDIEAVLAAVKLIGGNPTRPPKITGYVHLHRRLLKNPIMANPLLPRVFMELLLLSSSKGDVAINSLPESVKVIGELNYAKALVLLEKEHNIIKTEIKPDGLAVRILKWFSYQTNDDEMESVIIRDMDNPEEAITPQKITEQPEFAIPPSTPPPNSNININNINNSLSLRANEVSDDKKKTNKENEPVATEPAITETAESEPEATTTAPPKKKRKKKEVTLPKDPYNIAEYEPEFRPYVLDAHELYERYRDNLRKASSRLTVVNLIVGLLTRYSKSDMISCIDNYSAEVKRKRTEEKFIRTADTFFKDLYYAYLPGELPKNSPSAPPERKKTKMVIPEPEYAVPDIPMKGDK